VVQLDAQLCERSLCLGSEAARRLVARVHHIPRGPFDAAALIEEPSGWLGLLVLDGLVAVGLDAGRAQVSWLVGAEDLIRPWELCDIPLTEQASWHALVNARVALLDSDFSRRVGGVPEVSQALLRRATQTSHWLLAKSLVISAPVVEDRLLLLFGLLAERWGKVRPEGVWLTLPLTHDLIARMCGARRPSVTMALRSLAEAGIVECTRRGCWILHGGPPPHLTHGFAANACWQRYADAIGIGSVTGRDDDAPWRPNDRVA
jgi:hypothetical protein